MPYGLPAVVASVNYYPEPRCRDPVLGRQLLDHTVNLGQKPQILGTGLTEGRDMLFRYNQKVYRRLRIDVLEGKNLLILVDRCARNLPGYQPAEEAVLH